jgi:hypothetical protein
VQGPAETNRFGLDAAGAGARKRRRSRRAGKDGDLQVRIRRYERAVDQSGGAAELPADVSARGIIAARTVSATPISIDDVIEASSKIASPALEAALVESGPRFDLDSRALIKLADNGVQKNVIDLMVALSFPDHFKVERTVRSAAPVVTYSGSPYGGNYGYGAYSPYGLYDPYAYYSYYSPFAYSYWGTYNYGPGYYGSGYYGPGYYGPGYYGPGGSVVVVPSAPSGETSGSHGRVIQGRGYTQVRPNDASDSSGAGQSATTSRTNGSTYSSGSTDSGSSSGGGSGGVSSGGYSSGGSGGGSGSDSGRTAQPR